MGAQRGGGARGQAASEKVYSARSDSSPPVPSPLSQPVRMAETPTARTVFTLAMTRSTWSGYRAGIAIDASGYIGLECADGSTPPWLLKVTIDRRPSDRVMPPSRSRHPPRSRPAA